MNDRAEAIARFLRAPRNADKLSLLIDVFDRWPTVTRAELQAAVDDVTERLAKRLAKPTPQPAEPLTPTEAFLRSARITDDPAGDLIKDMRLDTELPPLFRNIDHVRSYLREYRSCPEAMATVPQFWQRYRR